VKAPILPYWRTVDRAADPATGAPHYEALHADEPTARAYLDALPAGRVAVSARAWPCRQRGAWLVPVEQGWANVPVGRLRRAA
jgi:hypothetical protein